MKFREFLRKISRNSVPGVFHQVRTDLDPFEVRDQDLSVSSNIELRLIDSQQSEPQQSASGIRPTGFENNQDFVEPERISEELRVYNSPNEAIPFVADDFTRYSEGLCESDHDPLRGSTDDPIVFHGDQSSLLFSNNSHQISNYAKRVTLMFGIVATIAIIGFTAVVIIRSDKSSKSSLIGPEISKPTLLDRGQQDFLAIFNREWPLPDTDSFSSVQNNDTGETIPDDLNPIYYTTEHSTKDLKNADEHSKLNKIIPTTVEQTTLNPIHLPSTKIDQKYVDSDIIQAAISDAKQVLLIQAEIDNKTYANPGFSGENSPEALYEYFNKIRHDNLLSATSKFPMEETYGSVVKRMKLTKQEANKGRILLNATIPQDWCSAPQDSNFTCNKVSPYQTLDGSCNNLKQITWGSSNLPYRRILFPNYDDGISKPRYLSTGGHHLPTPWEVSNKVHVDETREDHSASSMFHLWAQFVYNDLVFTPTASGPNGESIACCQNNRPIHTPNPNCLHIRSPEGHLLNESHKGRKSCVPFVRSATYQGCQLGPREQINQATSYLDASSIYGTTTVISNSLRVGKFGRLKTFPIHQMRHGQRYLMPIIPDSNDTCNQQQSEGDFCFQAGDVRVNEIATLTSLHTLWVRQHNRISEHLISQNPHWNDDEKVFQETRRIVTAQIQHITYNEFLPELLGSELLNKTGLKLLDKDYYQSYDPIINPSTSNVFGTAFRFSHSMVPGSVKMSDMKRKHEPLQSFAMNSSYLWTEGEMDGILKGAAIQAASMADIYVSNQLTRHYLEKSNYSSGLNLVAMDIQRSRDHGLPSYSEWRKICGLSSIKEFTGLHDVWLEDAIKRISKVYRSAEDIDLFTGMLAEKHVPGGRVGPTLACILIDQFLRLRKGDRFWYEGDIQIKPFTPGTNYNSNVNTKLWVLEQLKSIRSSYLARILCDNGDKINEMQSRAMIRPSPINKNFIQPCYLLPPFHFGPWKEKITYEFPPSESSDSHENSIVNEIKRKSPKLKDSHKKGQDLTILNLSPKLSEQTKNFVRYHNK